MTIRWAEVTHARFATGLRCVLYFGNLGVVRTPWINGKTRAEFNHEEIITIEQVKPEHIDWLENGMAKILLESKHKDDDSVSR